MKELNKKRREKLENQQAADENLPENLAEVEGAGTQQLSMNQLFLLLLVQLMLQYHHNMMQPLKLHYQLLQSLQLIPQLLHLFLPLQHHLLLHLSLHHVICLSLLQPSICPRPPDELYVKQSLLKGERFGPQVQIHSPQNLHHKYHSPQVQKNLHHHHHMTHHHHNHHHPWKITWMHLQVQPQL